MKKTSLTFSAVIISFCIGYTFNSFLNNHFEKKVKYKKVTGIGGIFFKAKDPKSLKAWYRANLGLETNDFGTVFEWYQGADSTRKGFLQWSPFKEKTNYFEPSVKDFMINYRVDNMDALVSDLKQSGVVITDSIQTYEYGKFVHILDIEGNKIELWEPNDEAYEKLGKEMGLQTTR